MASSRNNSKPGGVSDTNVSNGVTTEVKSGSELKPSGDTNCETKGIDLLFMFHHISYFYNLRHSKAA